MSERENMDHDPATEEDTASGGSAEPRTPDDDERDTSVSQESGTDEDGTPTENPRTDPRG